LSHVARTHTFFPVHWVLVVQLDGSGQWYKISLQILTVFVISSFSAWHWLGHSMTSSLLKTLSRQFLKVCFWILA